MIDPQTETLISLTAATKHFPARRAGKKPHVSCIYRWTKDGCRGVKLESVQVGGTRCTSREAIARFIQRLTEGAQGLPHQLTRPQRARLIEQASRELDEAGIN
jgi:hypothetical protein